MIMKKQLHTMAATAIFALASLGNAAGVSPFTETFSTDAADWKTGASLEPTWFATGCPSGSAYISTVFNFEAASGGFGNTSVLFRGQESFDSSGGAFVGDWLTSNITLFSMVVRHNAPEAIDFNVRFAPAANTPGAISNNVSVEPGQWTEIAIAIDPSAFQSFSGPPSNFGVTFSDLANIQVSINRPSSLDDDTTNYDFDFASPSIIPEPSSVLLLAMATGALGLLRRRRV